jgi:hypothetical protein
MELQIFIWQLTFLGYFIYQVISDEPGKADG